MTKPKEVYDAFISHATEDKEPFVRALANFLREAGLTIWYDEFTLKAGDSLSRSIDKGLAQSNFGIVVLSPAFLKKKWPEYELQGLVAKEISSKKVIIPIWLNLNKKQLLKYSPTLADKFAIQANVKKSMISIAYEIIEAIRPDLHEQYHRRLRMLHMGPRNEQRKIKVDAIVPSPIRHAALAEDLISRIRLVRAS